MQASHYSFQSPNEKNNKASHGQTQFQLMQSTAYGTNNNFRETVTSFHSSTSQPLRYSTTQYNQSPEREPVQSMGASKYQGSSMISLHKQSTVSQVPVQQSVNSNGDVRERIITTYREEIKMHVARERDFQHLEALIADLQRKTQLLELNLSESQKEHEDRLSSQAKTIAHHQSDIENLKKNVAEKQQEGIRVCDDIQRVKSEIVSKETEIYQMSKDNESTKAYNDQLRREVDFLQQDIFNGQDLKKRQQTQIYNMKNDLRYQEKEIGDQSTKLAVLDKEHHSLVDRMHYLNKQLDAKDVANEKTSANLAHTQRDVAMLQSSINALDVEIVEVERSNDRNAEMQKKLLRTKDGEAIRGQDLSFNLKEQEKRLRDNEVQCEHLRKEVENLKYGNEVLLDRNHELKVELDSLNSHAELLTAQNRDLQHELDSFVETDEVVRRNLDRKDKVYQIRSKVDEVIKKSMIDLNAKSPSRIRSPVQTQYNGPQEDEIRQTQQQQFRQSHFYESMNNRGSPLRRVNLDH